MNRKLIPTIVAILGAALLQVAIAPYIAIGGVVPNLLLLVVVTLALVEGPRAGASAGFAAGLAFDLLGSGPLGPMALVLTVVGHVTGSLQVNMFAEGWLLPMTVVFFGGLVTEVSYGLVLMLLGSGAPFWATLGHVMLPGAVYNGALALLIYPWLAQLLHRDRPMRTFRRLA
ncbi:MAG: rod shape-determining protein MreD [Coriobacteriia bacterium]|nr:rod shape-determining protein MreD [Coriobacteriia bacterium]